MWSAYRTCRCRYPETSWPRPPRRSAMALAPHSTAHTFSAPIRAGKAFYIRRTHLIQYLQEASPHTLRVLVLACGSDTRAGHTSGRDDVGKLVRRRFSGGAALRSEFKRCQFSTTHAHSEVTGGREREELSRELFVLYFAAVALTQSCLTFPMH